MWLEDFFDQEGVGKLKINKLARESSTFNSFYFFWRDNLFERIMRLFVWENTYDPKTGIGVKPKEIEQRLALKGHCGIAKLKGDKEVTAFFGSFNGVTKYYDEKKNYMVRCPIYSGNLEIDTNVVVIDNCQLRNPLYPLVHHYAVMLAHNEVTLVDAMVNLRDSGIPVAMTEKQRVAIADYQGKVFNGEYGQVTDPSMMGVNVIATKMDKEAIRDIYEVREKLLKSFYSDIGIRSAFEKKNNAVEAEVEADSSLLLFNLGDMIACRKEGAEKVNKVFGLNWSVHIAEEIDYGEENQRVQFDDASKVHVHADDVQKGE